MEQDLISKKELLEYADISYGQLYRWKRKNLIPEDWFIRKATFTGQETFFPRDKILARIDQIKNMKDDLSLDKLADMFSPSPSEIEVSVSDIAKRNIVTNVALQLFQESHPDVQTLLFDHLVSLYVLDAALQSGDINLEEGRLLLRTLEENYAKFTERNCIVMFLRKLGVSSCLLVSGASQIHFDSALRVIVQFHLPTYVESLKAKLAREVS